MLLKHTINRMNGQIDNRKILNMCQLFRNKVYIYIHMYVYIHTHTHTHTEPQEVVISSAFRNSSALKFYILDDYTHCLSVLVLALLNFIT
jgi:hypothetical protein